MKDISTVRHKLDIWKLKHLGRSDGTLSSAKEREHHRLFVSAPECCLEAVGIVAGRNCNIYERRFRRKLQSPIPEGHRHIR